MYTPEETPNPKRDSKTTGRYYVYYRPVFSESKTRLHMLSPCFLEVASWVWNLFWGIYGYCVRSRSHPHH